MSNKQDVGEVHARVEDTEVPWGLKILVVFLFMGLLALIIFIAVSTNPAAAMLPALLGR